MLDLLLVRHGQSVWNADGRWQGQADPPLSPLGAAQAAAAAALVPPVEVIVSSTLARAAATAAIIAEGVGVTKVLSDPALVERDAGEWSGLTRAEIEAGWPGYLDDERRPPGWEPDESVLARALGAVDRLVAAYAGGEVLVVCHGGVIYAIERHLGAPFERIPNLGGRWLHWRNGHLSLGERVLLVDPDALTVQAPDLL